MDTADEPVASVALDKSRTRTPAYASFDSNTDNLLHLLRLILRGIRNFADEMNTSVDPQLAILFKEIATLGRRHEQETNEQVADRQTHEGESVLSVQRPSAEIAHDISDILTKPAAQFTDGLLTILRWIPVILVTTVESYLKDVRMFEAKVNTAIMESSTQSVTYAEVAKSRSIDDLTEEMRSRWARHFVDDGGPTRWIDKLTKMGARGYDSQAGDKMETLWGVRHVIVHSAGVATSEFVGRHPDFGAKVGASIVIRYAQLSEWIDVTYHFVDVTDFYFSQRYVPAPVSNT